MLVAGCWFGPWWGLAAAIAGSLLYERYLDRNGWSWTDVGQRSIGLVLGLVLILARRLI